jgi:hypothetical protein
MAGLQICTGYSRSPAAVSSFAVDLRGRNRFVPRPSGSCRQPPPRLTPPDASSPPRLSCSWSASTRCADEVRRVKSRFSRPVILRVFPHNRVESKCRSR